MILDLVLRALLIWVYRKFVPRTADERLGLNTSNRVVWLDADEAARRANAWQTFAQAHGLVERSGGVLEGALAGVKAQLDSGLRDTRAYCPVVTLELAWPFADTRLLRRETDGPEFVTASTLGGKMRLTFDPDAELEEILATSERVITLARRHTRDSAS